MEKQFVSKVKTLVFNSKWVLEGANMPNGLNAPGPSVHLGIHSVTRTLNPITKNPSPITMQSSTAVTHGILAARQFTYPEEIES